MQTDEQTNNLHMTSEEQKNLEMMEAIYEREFGEKISFDHVEIRRQCFVASKLEKSITDKTDYSDVIQAVPHETSRARYFIVPQKENASITLIDVTSSDAFEGKNLQGKSKKYGSAFRIKFLSDVDPIFLENKNATGAEKKRITNSLSAFDGKYVDATNPAKVYALLHYDKNYVANKANVRIITSYLNAYVCNEADNRAEITRRQRADRVGELRRKIKDKGRNFLEKFCSKIRGNRQI